MKIYSEATGQCEIPFYIYLCIYDNLRNTICIVFGTHNYLEIYEKIVFLNQISYWYKTSFYLFRKLPFKYGLCVHWHIWTWLLLLQAVSELNSVFLPYAKG